MSHHAAKNGYAALIERLNKFPQGAPESDLLYRILALLFSEQEAEQVSRLPLRPFGVEAAARLWKMPHSKARGILEQLARRAILLDIEHEDKMIYLLPPPMAGFFEFALMRVRRDLDQEELSRLYFQYLNVETPFVRELFGTGHTQMVRVLVAENAVCEELGAQVLDYERCSEIIRSADAIAVGLCYCRHKMAHLGRACEAPLDNCMTLSLAAQSLIRNGVARAIDVPEALDLLQQARSLNLVQCADNVQTGVNFICHCCGCCCEAMLAVRRLAIPHAVCTTNFLPKLDGGSCSGCGACSRACPVAAISMGTADDTAARPPKPDLQEEICLGCGACVQACPPRAWRLITRPRRMITPVNTAHRVVLMAIERGKLQNLIFDNQAHLSHRLMAAVLGVILRLPPLKQALAKSQLKSQYLETIMAQVEVTTLCR